MAGTIIKTGPIALSNVYTTDIHNPSATTVDYLRQIHVANKTGAPATFRLYMGATGGNAAGTELHFDESVPANGSIDKYWQPGLKFKNADFLVGGASAATTLTITLTLESCIL